MGWYLLKLAILLPLMAGLIWGSLKLTKRLGGGFGKPPEEEARARIVQTSFVAPGVRLAVIAFNGREILVSASKQGLVRLADTPARGEA